MKFFPDFSLHLQNKVLLLHHQNLLSYGVTVTQQILVLLFQVRILVAQLKKDASHAGHPFSLSGYFPAFPECGAFPSLAGAFLPVPNGPQNPRFPSGHSFQTKSHAERPSPQIETRKAAKMLKNDYFSGILFAR